MERIIPRTDYLRQPLPQIMRARMQAGGSAGRGFAALILPRNYRGKLMQVTAAGYLSDDANTARVRICTQLGAEFFRSDIRVIGSPGVTSVAPVTPPNPTGSGAEAYCFASQPVNQPGFIERVIPDSSGVLIYYDCDSADVSTVDLTLYFELEITGAV